MRRNILRTPLARWGFSVLAVFSYANDLFVPAVVCGVVALCAWKIR